MLNRTPSGENSRRASPIADLKDFGRGTVRRGLRIIGGSRRSTRLHRDFSAIRLPISRVASLASSLFRSSRSSAAREMIFAHSSIGRAAQDTRLYPPVCFVKILRASPVAGFTLQYGTVSSFALRWQLITTPHLAAFVPFFKAAQSLP